MRPPRPFGTAIIGRFFVSGHCRAGGRLDTLAASLLPELQIITLAAHVKAALKWAIANAFVPVYGTPGGCVYKSIGPPNAQPD